MIKSIEVRIISRAITIYFLEVYMAQNRETLWTKSLT